jgi:hypothetical protein
VFGSTVNCAVVVIMTEIPRFAGLDALLAAPAVNDASGYLWFPLCAERGVLTAVAAGCRVASALVSLAVAL